MNVGVVQPAPLVDAHRAVAVPDRSNSRFINALLFACPLTASFNSAFGAVTVAGQTLYPFKVVVPLLAIALGWRALDLLTRPGSYPFMLALLAGWGVVGLAWTPDRTAGLKEVSVIVFAALVTAAVAVAVRAPDGVRWLLRGWLAGVTVTVLVALWELGSGQHLPSEFVNQHALGDGVLLATFGNPNNFGAFLVLSIPFIGIVATRPAVRWELGRTDRVLARILLVLLPILLLLSGSRFALIGLVVASGAYVALNRRDRSAWRFGGLLLLAGTGLSTFAIESGQRIVAKLGRFTDPSAFVQDSTEIRANLVLNGLVYLGRSGGVGIGPAGFEESIASGDVAFAVRPGVVNAHNFWVELLSQYGLIGGLLLGVVIVSATATYVRMTRDRPYGADRHRATLMLTGLAGYVFASMTASSYINAPENWMFIASFLALAPALVTIGREGRSLDDRVDTDEESGVVAASSGT